MNRVPNYIEASMIFENCALKDCDNCEGVACALKQKTISTQTTERAHRNRERISPVSD